MDKQGIRQEIKSNCWDASQTAVLARQQKQLARGGCLTKGSSRFLIPQKLPWNIFLKVSLQFSQEL